MARSPLFGRRIHLAGSISPLIGEAPKDGVLRAREFVLGLTTELLRAGACFVLPVDAEKKREDGEPVCFDWLAWNTISDNLTLRPAGAPLPLVVAVKHHKNEEQVPAEYAQTWDRLRSCDLVHIESAAHWNMASKRMEAQAAHGDILIAIGGQEGVQFLANLYHDAGKPVIPVNFKLGFPRQGAQRLFELGLSRTHASRLFQTESAMGAHGWINRLESSARKPIGEQVREVMALLEALVPPRAFGVRLLDSDHVDYGTVQDFFDVVVKPVVEGEMGYRLTVLDARHGHEHAFIDQEIFAKLHRSQLVIADITGLRPNCFLELGYALGRELPTVLTARQGTKHPFDIVAFGGHHWRDGGLAEDRRRDLRDHLVAVRTRPPLVPNEPLIP